MYFNQTEEFYMATSFVLNQSRRQLKGELHKQRITHNVTLQITAQNNKCFLSSLIFQGHWDLNEFGSKVWMSQIYGPRNLNMNTTTGNNGCYMEVNINRIIQQEFAWNCVTIGDIIGITNITEWVFLIVSECMHSSSPNVLDFPSRIFKFIGLVRTTSPSA